MDMSEMLMDEDIPILATTWIPSAIEANAIRSRNMARREEIREIDKVIAALQTRRHRLAATCDIGDAIIAPIRKIPVEILTSIFMQCIPPLSTKRRRWLTNSRTSRPQDIGELLRNVCRAWRTIVDNDPRIWARFVLDTKIQAPEYVKHLLKKSKSHPLEIFIQPYRWFWHTDQQMDETKVVFDMLHRELWRIRTLISDMRSRREEMFPQGLFPQGFPITAPMMQTFKEIRESCPHGDFDLDRFYCPKIHSITLENSENIVRCLVATPIQTVRHLEVRFREGLTALYLQLLSTLPNLVSLHWEGVEESEGDVQGTPSKIILQSLKLLRVHTTGSAKYLLPSLSVPSLKSLELVLAYIDIEGRGLCEAIDTLCRNGAVKLRRLHILNGFLTGPEYATTLRQLDHLDTLIIEHATHLDGVLAILAPHDRDFSSVCPKLTTVVIIKSELPAGPFVDFVYRRTRADWEEAAPGYVTILKLSWIGRIGGELCEHFSRTHSTTIHYMSSDEYRGTSLALALSPEDDQQDDGWE